MKTSPDIAFLQKAVAVRRDLETTRAVERQAEARRRDLPFPDAVDPDALVADGRLVDISLLARCAIDAGNTVRGFSTSVYGTAAVGGTTQRLGVELTVVVAAAWWACRREGMEGGLPRKGGTTRAMPFLVKGPADAENWYCYQATQRPSGQVFGVIYVRGEENPAVPSSTADRKDGTNARV
jgi:hypothetical protein